VLQKQIVDRRKALVISIDQNAPPLKAPASPGFVGKRIKPESGRTLRPASGLEACALNPTGQMYRGGKNSQNRVGRSGILP
jgi:hypothetical protein